MFESADINDDNCTQFLLFDNVEFKERVQVAHLPPPAALPLMLIGQHSPCAGLAPDADVASGMQCVRWNTL